LAFLTVKYDVHPDVLFCALLAAGEMEKAKCGPLSIECLGKVDGKTYFLIKEGSQVVSQIPISDELLASKVNPVRDFMEADIVQNYNPDEPGELVCSDIGNLKVGQTHVNLTAEVVDVSEPRQVHTKFGSNARLAKALLRNNTGEIKLCLWKELVDAVSVGDQVEIKDATVTKFEGKEQLALGRKGVVKVLKTLPKLN
jgi:replication factor A1